MNVECFIDNKIPSFKKTVYFDDKTVDDLLRVSLMKPYF